MLHNSIRSLKRGNTFSIALAALVWVTSAASAQAATFFVAPNNPGATDPTLDQAWQTAVGGDFDENSLDLSVPSVDTVVVGLGNGADTLGIFYGSYSGGGSGTVEGGALLNSSGRDPDMIFSFAHAITGFGAWIFDDGGSSSTFTMTVTEVGGNVFTSGVLDSNVGMGVAGFLGVTSVAGILTATITRVEGADFFEVDNLQVSTTSLQSTSPVLLPVAAWLFASVIGGAGSMRRLFLG